MHQLVDLVHREVDCLSTLFDPLLELLDEGSSSFFSTRP